MATQKLICYACGKVFQGEKPESGYAYCSTHSAFRRGSESSPAPEMVNPEAPLPGPLDDPGFNPVPVSGAASRSVAIPNDDIDGRMPTDELEEEETNVHDVSPADDGDE